MTHTVRVDITLKPGIADPQGQTIEKALPALGYSGVENVRVGKLIEMEVEAESAAEGQERANEMCERLLANPVIEAYEVHVG